MTVRNKLVFDDLKIEDGYWYAGSPYSRYPTGIQTAFEDIAVITAQLLKHKIRAYSPIVHSHTLAVEGGINPYDHDIWMWADEPFMKGAYGLIVVMMETWRESKGLMQEIAIFEKDGKPVYFLDPTEDLGL